MKNALVLSEQVWKSVDFVRQATASLRGRRVFTTENSCIYNNSKTKIIKDGAVLIASPTEGETYVLSFLFLFVQITIFLYQWQIKCLPSFITLREVICTSDPSITPILQCNLMTSSNNEGIFPLFW